MKLISNFDYCDKKYNEIINLAFNYSEHFTCCSFKYLHNKDKEQSYLDFYKAVAHFECDKFLFEQPKQYEKSQNFNVYSLNENTKSKILEVGSFRNWWAGYYPEDLAFYHNKKLWFRCITHEELIYIKTTNNKILDELSNIGVSFKNYDLDERI